MQREIDAEIEAKNIGAALGIPLAVIAYLIERARADELDETRERFGLARMDSDPSGQVIEGLYADGPDDENDNGEEDEYDSDTLVSYDDEGADDLDEDNYDYEIDYGEEDDGEGYDPNGYDAPDDDDDQKSGPVMRM
ncbi:MAG: hypothetical protein IKX19_11675 [Clostridia bacterium]|nr:hypothetical protein [Clostridia bacterium]